RHPGAPGRLTSFSWRFRRDDELAARLDGATATNPLSGLYLSHGIRSGGLLPDLLGEPDEDPFGTADVAEPIRVLVLDHFADDHRAAFAEPGERIVDVLHGEHDAEIAESVHRGVAVIGGHGRREKPRQLEPAVAVRRAHHGNLDPHVRQSGDAISPG